MHAEPCPVPGLCLAAALLVFLPAAAGAAAITAFLGDEIPLAGENPGGGTVYLFLTGPNLPAGGVRLGDAAPVTTGVPGSFTRVDTGTGGTWQYRWNTKSLGSALDAGTYTVYAAQEPAGARDLAGVEYGTVPVVLRVPALTAFTAAPTAPGIPVPRAGEAGTSPAAPGTMEAAAVTATAAAPATPSAPATTAIPLPVPAAIIAVAIVPAARSRASWP